MLDLAAIQVRRHGRVDDPLYHIYREDNVLFKMGDHAMTDGDRQELCSKFCEVGCETFGGKKREELEAVADELERHWPDS